MDTQPNNLGNPGRNATKIQKINYSNQITKLSKEEQDSIDLVLIDGRFLVAFCLKCYDCINDKCFIAFDDSFAASKNCLFLASMVICAKRNRSMATL